MKRSSLLTRVATTLPFLAVLAAIGSCRDISGPNPLMRAGYASIAVNPVFQTATASGTVQFVKVRIIIHRTDGSVALDTLVDFPAGASQVTLSLPVPLAVTAPPSGEEFSLNLEMLNAAGDVVFRGGPISVHAAEGETPAPLDVPATYTGPGATATRVSISQSAAVIIPGTSFDFSATAYDAASVALPGTPIQWTSLDPSIAIVPDPSTGHAVAVANRGTARIRATLVTGQTADATLKIQALATSMIVASGNAQTGGAGAPLAQPLAVKVLAADGLGVDNVVVSFAIGSGGGSLSASSATSDANGIASVIYTPGGTPGPATVIASASGLQGSPLTFTATIAAGAATQLVFSSQPTGGVSGVDLPAFSVQARDAFNNPSTAYTGTVSIALSAPPTGVTLTGTLSATAVNGVATFSAARINGSGTGLRLAATGTGSVTAATSNAFNVAPPAPTQLVITTQPAQTVVGNPVQVVVEARTATNVLSSTYSGTIFATIASGPNGGAIVGSTLTNFVNGIATLNVVFNGAGTYRMALTASGVGQVLTQPFLVFTNDPATIDIVSGDAQSALAGGTLAQPLVVLARDASGTPAGGAILTWNVDAGGGSVTPVSAVTDANGIASTSWRLGATGTQQVSASFGAVRSPAFNATIVGGGPTGTISGLIRDASNLAAIANATVEVRAGTNVITGPAASTTTSNASGNYTLTNAPSGNVTVLVHATGYADAVANVTVTANQTTTANILMSTSLAPGQVRIVLTWAAQPRDLDSYLAIPGFPTVYYGNRGSCSATVAPYACLDIDQTNGFGPETITIYQVLTGTYTYSVNNFSGSPALSTSQAHVDVYIGNTLTNSFNMPNQPGFTWTVFTLNGTTVTPVNTVNLVAPAVPLVPPRPKGQ